MKKNIKTKAICWEIKYLSRFGNQTEPFIESFASLAKEPEEAVRGYLHTYFPNAPHYHFTMICKNKYRIYDPTSPKCYRADWTICRL